MTAKKPAEAWGRGLPVAEVRSLTQRRRGAGDFNQERLKSGDYISSAATSHRTPKSISDGLGRLSYLRTDRRLMDTLDFDVFRQSNVALPVALISFNNVNHPR